MYSLYTVVLFNKSDIRTWQKSASEALPSIQSFELLLAIAMIKEKTTKKIYKRYFQVNFQ